MRVLCLLVTVLALAVLAPARPRADLVTITNGTTTVGFSLACGGAIADIHTDTIANVVDTWDCGRYVQVALYDGAQAYDPCAGCQGVFGWNPVQAGDRYGHGSPIEASSFSTDAAYVRSRPLEWYPDNKGGGPTQPVLSDVQLEHWVTFEADGAVRSRWLVTHLGSDTHANALQELPVSYTLRGRDTFRYYSGSAPWTLDTLSALTWPELGSTPLGTFATTETWGAMTDAAGVGLSLYVPRAYPWPGGFSVSSQPGGTNMSRPWTEASLPPGGVIDVTAYVYLGDVNASRSAITARHQSDPSPDAFSPLGVLDVPVSGASVSGTVTVGGWAFDNVGLQRVDIVVDGVVVGQAALGASRPDVPTVYPGAPSNSGWNYAWNTKKAGNGSHVVSARAVDLSGRVAYLVPRSVTVTNGGGGRGGALIR